MTQEDKELLLKDLCARLPYGVKMRYKSVEGEGDIKLGYGNIGYIPELGRGWWIECKPYLRPMSSMTEEELADYKSLEKQCEVLPTFAYISVSKCIIFDWLNAHHFDYRDLIPIGLAIEVTEENNPYKK